MSVVIECADCGFVGDPAIGEGDYYYCQECESINVTQCEVDMNQWVTSVLPKDDVMMNLAKTYRDVWTKIARNNSDS